MKRYITLLLLLLSATAYAQDGANWKKYFVKGSLAVGKLLYNKADSATYAKNCAWLEIGTDTTTKGFIIPRVLDVTTIDSPVKGLMAYDLTESAVKLYDGTDWTDIGSGGGGSVGNAGYGLLKSGSTFRVDTSVIVNMRFLDSVLTAGDYASETFVTDAIAAIDLTGYATKDTLVNYANKFNYLVNANGVLTTDTLYYSDTYTMREIGNIIRNDSGLYIMGITVDKNPGSAVDSQYVRILTSPDGDSWTMVSELPRKSEDPWLFLEDDGYTVTVYYEDKDDIPFRNIRAHQAADLVNWTDLGDVLNAGTSGAWDDRDVSSPVVKRYGDSRILYYEGRNVTTDTFPHEAIGVAISTDATSFVKQSNPIIAGRSMWGDTATVLWAPNTVCDDVDTIDGKYVMFIHAQTTSLGYQTGMLVSDDPITGWRDAKGGYLYKDGNNGEDIMIFRKGSMIKPVLYARGNRHVVTGEWSNTQTFIDPVRVLDNISLIYGTKRFSTTKGINIGVLGGSNVGAGFVAGAGMFCDFSSGQGASSSSYNRDFGFGKNTVSTRAYLYHYGAGGVRVFDGYVVTTADTAALYEKIVNSTSPNNALLQAKTTGLSGTRNVNDANTLFILDQQQGTGDPLDVRYGGSTKFKVDYTGVMGVNAIKNLTSSNNARINLTTGTQITKNLTTSGAPTLSLIDYSVGSADNILNATNSSGLVAAITHDGYIIAGAPTYSSGGYSTMVFNTGTGRYERRDSLDYTRDIGGRPNLSTYALKSYVTDTLGYYIKQGGNSFGATMRIGSNDNQNVAIKKNGTDVLTVTTGNVSVTGNVTTSSYVAAAGYVSTRTGFNQEANGLNYWAWQMGSNKQLELKRFNNGSIVGTPVSIDTGGATITITPNIIAPAPDYSSGDYSMLVRNTASGRFEKVSGSTYARQSGLDDTASALRAAISGGGVAWGGITGSIADQTDLQTALNAKVPFVRTVNGQALSSDISLATSDISEATDKRYVTDAQLVVLSNTSGTNTGDQTTITGNAGTATALQTARNINGIAFDGTANITVTAAAGTLTGSTLASGVTASSLTSVGTLTALTLGGTLAMGSNSITMTGSIASTGSRVTKVWATDIESTNAPTVGGTPLPTATSTTTLTNKRIIQRVTTTASSSTPTPDADASDMYTVTALAAGATFGAPTGTPTDGQPLLIRIKDNGTARSLAWNAIYRAGTVLALPTTTTISKTMYVQFIYNTADSKWDLVGYTDGL